MAELRNACAAPFGAPYDFYIELGDWLRGAGIAETVVEPDSGYVLFRGRKAA